MCCTSHSICSSSDRTGGVLGFMPQIFGRTKVGSNAHYYPLVVLGPSISSFLAPLDQHDHETSQRNEEGRPRCQASVVHRTKPSEWVARVKTWRRRAFLAVLA